MKNAILKPALILTGLCILASCKSTNRPTIKNQQKMFTTEQIKAAHSKVKSGADFPALAMNLKNIGVTYYETKIEDGSSIFRDENGYELPIGPNYSSIKVADKVNLENLKMDIANHQQGKSDYFQISQQSADSGIERWAVSLIDMTCSYIDKTGSIIWVEHIPDANAVLFTVEQIKAAHSKVKSGADFPGYIQELKKLGVTYYETFVTDGHTDYYGANNYKTTSAAKYQALQIADTPMVEQFKTDLLAHQQGKTDYPTFCTQAAKSGVEMWEVCMEKMTCTYYDPEGRILLEEKVPQ